MLKKIYIFILLLVMLIPSKDTLADDQKTIYLTFDDGPSKTTLEVLDVLDSYNIKGTFFIIGSLAEENPKIIMEIYQRGHLIGNHTYSHKSDEIYASESNLIDEINKTNKVIKEIVPEYDEKIFRFPYGSFKYKSLEKTVERMGYSHFNWNLDAGDSGLITISTDQIIKNVMKDIKYQKSVILFHDSYGKDTTPLALRVIIERLLSKGYCFETLNDKNINSF